MLDVDTFLTILYVIGGFCASHKHEKATTKVAHNGFLMNLSTDISGMLLFSEAEDNTTATVERKNVPWVI